MAQAQEQKSPIELSGEPYENFIQSIRADATRQAYDNGLRFYMKQSGLSNVEGLICKGEVKPIQSSIIKFVWSQRQKGVSSSLISLRLSAIKKFYDMNDLLLNWSKIYSFIGESTPIHKDRPYSRDDIRKLLTVCDLRDRMIILLLSSSGMRIGGLRELKVGDLQRIEKHDLYKITVYACTREEYYTYCTPECAHSIDQWLEQRKRAGEKIEDSSYLLRDYFDKNDPLRVAHPRRLKLNTMQWIIHNKLVHIGIRVKAQKGSSRGTVRHEVKISHGFRKFFDTTATQAGVAPLYVELLAGHKIGLKGSYFRPTENDLLEGNDKMPGYLTAINALTISNEERLKVELGKVTQKLSAEEEIRLKVEEKYERNLKAMREEFKREIQTIHQKIDPKKLVDSEVVR